jgi:hypothetical protein
MNNSMKKHWFFKMSTKFHTIYTNNVALPHVASVRDFQITIINMLKESVDKKNVKEMESVRNN